MFPFIFVILSWVRVQKFLRVKCISFHLFTEKGGSERFNGFFKVTSQDGNLGVLTPGPLIFPLPTHCLLVLNNQVPLLIGFPDWKRIVALDKEEILTGTCPDMCPEKEHYLREIQSQLSPFEMLPGTDKVPVPP